MSDTSSTNTSDIESVVESVEESVVTAVKEPSKKKKNVDDKTKKRKRDDVDDDAKELKKRIKRIHKPRSGYNLFSIEQIPLIRAETDKKLSISEIATAVSQKWKDVTDRSKYVALAAADVVRFDTEIEEAGMTYSDFGLKKKKKLTDPNMPKRSMNAYIMFVNENHSTYKKNFPDLSHTEISKKITDDWKNFSTTNPELKNMYTTKAADAKAEWTKRRDEYMQSDLRKEWEQKTNK